MDIAFTEISITSFGIQISNDYLTFTEMYCPEQKYIYKFIFLCSFRDKPICINNFLKCMHKSISSEICRRWFCCIHHMKYNPHLWIAINCCTLQDILDLQQQKQIGENCHMISKQNKYENTKVAEVWPEVLQILGTSLLQQDIFLSHRNWACLMYHIQLSPFLPEMVVLKITNLCFTQITGREGVGWVVIDDSLNGYTVLTTPKWTKLNYHAVNQQKRRMQHNKNKCP